MSDLDDSEPSLSGSAFLEAQRLRPSQNALRQLQDELTKGTASFKPPQTIVFSPAATYSNPTLAFDAKNKPLLAREDELVKLLTRLDAVESAGDDGIRKRRKEIVLEVEEELARLDQFKRDQFKALQSGSSQEHTIQETSQPEKRAGESIPRSNPGEILNLSSSLLTILDSPSASAQDLHLYRQLANLVQ